MEIISTLADISIRRACGFAALGIGTVMLALSFDLELALRSGAILTSLTCGVVWLCAWAAPYRDIRGTELWHMLANERLYLTRGPEAPRTRILVRRVLRDRLVWHAERVLLAALVMWCATGLVRLERYVNPG